MNNQADYDAMHPVDSDAGGALIPAAMRFLRLLLFRKQIVLTCLVGTSVLGAIYYAYADRLYQSTAKLLIVQQHQDRVDTVGDHESSDNIMATQRLLVLSPKVVEQAIETIDPRYLLDVREAPPHDWVEAVSSRLSASTTRKTNFITVSYRSIHPEAAAAMVSAVTDSYLGFVEQTHKGTAAELVEELEAALAERNQELSTKRGQLIQDRHRLRHLNVDAKDSVVDPIIQRAIRANDVYVSAQEKRRQIQATLTSVNAAVARGEDVQQYLAGLEDELGKNMMLASLGMSSQDLENLTKQEQRLLEARDELKSVSPFLGPSHPRVRALKQKVADIETYIAEYRLTAGRRFSGDGKGGIGEAVQDLLTKALQQAAETERQLGLAYNQVRDEAAERSAEIDRLQELNREVLRLEARRDAIEERIANVDIRQEQAPIRVTVVQEPVPDDRPVSPQLRLVVVGSLFGGLLLGMLTVYVQDVLDDRFASPEEITAQLAVPLLAVVRKLQQLPGSAPGEDPHQQGADVGRVGGLPHLAHFPEPQQRGLQPGAGLQLGARRREDDGIAAHWRHDRS